MASEVVGDCYEAALDTIMRMPAQVRDLARLCHGTVIGNAAPVLDLPFGHAWVEVGGTVFDNSNGRGTVTPKERYYARGRIDPATVARFEWDRAAVVALRTMHSGPWTDAEWRAADAARRATKKKRRKSR